MRPKENYTPFVTVAFGLTLGILVSFQIFIWREPARIEADELADRKAAVLAGRSLYGENCGACHGDEGEGGIGPALNSSELLKQTSDQVLFRPVQGSQVL